MGILSMNRRIYLWAVLALVLSGLTGLLGVAQAAPAEQTPAKDAEGEGYTQITGIDLSLDEEVGYPGQVVSGEIELSGNATRKTKTVKLSGPEMDPEFHEMDPGTSIPVQVVLPQQLGDHQYRANAGPAHEDFADVKVVTVGALQHRLKPEDEWGAGSLIVYKGTRVEFRAVRLPETTPTDNAWPSGKPEWGGAAEGVGPTTWVAFTSTGYHTVTVECGNDPALEVEVLVYELSFTARRKGSGHAFSTDATTVAAGAIGTDEHQADLLIQATPAVAGISVDTLTIKSGGLGGTSTVTATVGLSSSTTNSSGQITGTFTSGSRIQTTEIELDIDPEAETLLSFFFNQVWNSLAEPWTYDEYFDFDVPSTVTYSMAIDGSPITGHSMSFETLALDGFEWDEDAGEDLDEDGFPDGDYVPASYSIDDVDTTGFDMWSPLVSYTTTDEDPAGSYSTDQTIEFDWDFIADYVEFQVVDNGTYDETGA